MVGLKSAAIIIVSIIMVVVVVVVVAPQAGALVESRAHWWGQ